MTARGRRRVDGKDRAEESKEEGRGSLEEKGNNMKGGQEGGEQEAAGEVIGIDNHNITIITDQNIILLFNLTSLH